MHCKKNFKKSLVVGVLRNPSENSQNTLRTNPVAAALNQNSAFSLKIHQTIYSQVTQKTTTTKNNLLQMSVLGNTFSESSCSGCWTRAVQRLERCHTRRCWQMLPAGLVQRVLQCSSCVTTLALELCSRSPGWQDTIQRTGR